MGNGEKTRPRDENGVQWFSRRHQTSAARDAAAEAYVTRRDRRPRQYWDGDKWVKYWPSDDARRVA